MTDVSLFRLYLLRAFYLLIAVGQGLIQWPLLLSPHKWTLMSSVAHVMLAALATASLIGVRYPLKMLPLMFFEFLWKALWLALVALPLWRAGALDADHMESFWEILPGMLVLIAIPWRYVWATYVKAPGDRWR